MDEYTVYMHRLYDGRTYIGITSQPVERRWQNGHGYSKSGRFYNAIKKYGWDSFEHLILKTGLSKEEAERMEIELISQYESTERGKGFNVSLGGSCNVPLSEEVKQKIRDKQIGKKASEETKQKMSQMRKGRKQSPEHAANRAATRVGTHLSEETKAKISKATAISRKGKQHSEATKLKISQNSGKKRSIAQIGENGETLRVFSSLSDAARSCGTTPQNIWMAANRNRKHAGGYLWAYTTGGG